MLTLILVIAVTLPCVWLTVVHPNPVSCRLERSRITQGVVRAKYVTTRWCDTHALTDTLIIVSPWANHGTRADLAQELDDNMRHDAR